MALFISNAALVVVVATTGLLPASRAVPDISDIKQFLTHLKSTILQLIKNKLRELQNLVKYFNETKTSVSNLILSSVVLPNTFVLHSEDFLVVVLYVIYYKITSMIIFILIIIHFISIIIPLADFNSIKIFIAYKCFIDFCYA